MKPTSSNRTERPCRTRPNLAKSAAHCNRVCACVSSSRIPRWTGSAFTTDPASESPRRPNQRPRPTGRRRGSIVRTAHESDRRVGIDQVSAPPPRKRSGRSTTRSKPRDHRRLPVDPLGLPPPPNDQAHLPRLFFNRHRFSADSEAVAHLNRYTARGLTPTGVRQLRSPSTGRELC